MNATLEKTNHPSIQYYDGDYPSKYYDMYPENFDETVQYQGLAHDIDKYIELAKQMNGDVLELYCGTGRIAIPLAASGFNVTAVDFAIELLKQFDTKVKNSDGAISNKITIVEQDVTKLSLPKKDFKFIYCGFNSLLCITDFESQLQTLKNAANHLQKGGMLALDLMNPFILNFQGDSIVRPFFTRKNPVNGNSYTRFAASGPMNEKQIQKLYGWYDEIDAEGIVRRKHYDMHWRPVFRYEIELMLEKAGFKIDAIYGGHQNEPFTVSSRKMFIQAIKI